jgi:hypothetical protein
MFLQRVSQLRAWWEAATADILGADLPPTEPEEGPVAHFRAHPHRLTLHTSSPRRPGAVPARPAQCISPVRRQQTAGATRVEGR